MTNLNKNKNIKSYLSIQFAELNYCWEQTINFRVLSLQKLN